jgi:hypothetical protein
VRSLLSTESPIMSESEMVIMEPVPPVYKVPMNIPSMQVCFAIIRMIAIYNMRGPIMITIRRRIVIGRIVISRIIVGRIAVRVVERETYANLEIDAAVRHGSSR